MEGFTFRGSNSVIKKTRYSSGSIFYRFKGFTQVNGWMTCDFSSIDRKGSHLGEATLSSKYKIFLREHILSFQELYPNGWMDDL